MDNVVVLDIETSGLMASSCFISCVGVFSPSWGVRVFAGSESDLLLDFFEFVRSCPSEGPLVTYNGQSFDLPFLEARSKALGVKGAECLREFKHVDLMDTAKSRIGENKRFVSKAECANKLGIYCPKCCDGFFCAEIARQGIDHPDFFKILQHNALDLVETFELYNKMKALKWI